MRALGGLNLLLAIAICQGYQAYQRSSSRSSSSAFYGDEQSSPTVPHLNSWASAHFKEVRQMANQLKQKFNVLSQGSTVFGYLPPWTASILDLSKRSAHELDELSFKISQQLVLDMRQGNIAYSTIAQPNFFEAKAAELLERYAESESVNLQKTVGLGSFQPVDFSEYDEVKNYAYPAEVKVFEGKTYLVHRNCTETTTVPEQGVLGQTKHTFLDNKQTSIPFGSSMTTLTQKKTIRDWVRENMEPSVIGYNSVVNVDGHQKNSAYNQIATAFPQFSSDMIIHKFNKTITTNLDGTSTVDGSESQQRWQDGKLVFDRQNPISQKTVSSDEQWQREERERLFWYLTTPQQIVDWHQQQEERMLGVVHRYRISLAMLKEFHRRELARYQALLEQDQSHAQNISNWERQERGRLDWLIQQNCFTSQDLERWQNENNGKLSQIAQLHGLSRNKFQKWQREELQRLHAHLNQENELRDSQAAPLPLQSTYTYGSSSSLPEDNTKEQQRLDFLIGQHNATMIALQNSIKADQQRLKNLSIKYQGEMQSQTHWLRGEVARIGDLIKHQNEQVSQITAWQISERSRLETILLQHRGSLDELQLRMNQDRNYLQNLATKYKVSVEELETWQNKELKRLQDQGHQQLNDQIKNWQAIVSTNLRDIAVQNQLTLEEFKTYIISDRSHLEEMAKTYKVKVEEIEQLIKSELKKFQSEGLLKAVEQELILWQQKERDRLQAIVHQNSMTVEQLETRIKNDQDHFFKLADKYKISVEDIQDWLKKELLRLQSAGLIKAESLKEWQQQERAQISLLVQQNKYSFTELERKMLSDRARLQTISETYNIKVSEIEQWIKSEGDRLQKEGQLRMESQLNNWQKIEHQRLLDLINKNNLSIEEIESNISKDQTHLYSLAQQHQVRVEEIEQWIKKQIQNLQNQGLIEMNKLKDWQLEWRGNLTNMVQDRDFTVEEFHKWLLKDRSQLQNLAMQHNVQIEEIEQFVHKEEQRFIGMGLLKPNEKLTNWQEVERLHLKNLAQQQFKSTEQLEARLRQDRELLEHLARQYSVQVEEIESWMKQELARMRDEGQLQIDNLTSWQLAERERLETLIKQNQQWSADELRTELEKDREHMQTMAFQYHTSVEEIEKWIEGEVERLKQKGKLNIEKLSGWQRSEQHRIFSLLQQNSNITLEQFQSKIQNDRRFLIKLAEQHHVHIEEVEKYVKQVIDDLRKSGQFDIEQLQTWQKVERDYIKSLISEYKNGLSTAEYEEKLLADRAHLNHLADQYRLNVEQIEEWMIAELKRLRGSSEESLKNLSDWQVSELDRLQNLVKQQNHLTFVEFELELNQERERLQNLANKYSVSIVEIEDWLRQQLIKLRTTGQTTVENLSKWQVDEQQRLIELLLKKQQEIPYEQMEQELTQDNARLRTISQTHHVNIEQVDQWMREELRRLQSSGLIQFDQQTRWQQEISNGFKKWLKNQLNGASYKEFIAFLKRDKQRMDSIASEYHVTVEQVEKWVQKEAARLSLIGVIERPENHVKYEDIGNIWFDEQPATWKNELLSHLRSVTRERPFSQQEFESYLISNKPIFERITSQYHVTIADVHLWLSQSAKSEGLVTTEWQTKERLYIEELINQQHRKQQRWTIDELELWLSHDLKHLQDAVVQYHLTAEELKVWYKNELSRLVEQHKIDRGSDLAWHSQELQRIYLVIVNNTDIDKMALENLLFDDVHLLASQYQTSVDKLRQFILNKLSHFSDLGILKDVRRQSNNWHEQERNRLREVAAGVVITEKELLDFVAQDTSFQKQLAQFYQVGLDQLAPVQRIFIGNMKREKLLEQRRLNKLTTWQQRERDRLYEFIGNQNITQAELNNWQNQATNLLEEFSLKYEITAQQLKDWQKKELGRINQIARYYAMSQSDLQQFREGELRQIVHVNHRWFMTPTESKTYEKRFQWALSRLQSRFGTFGQDLVVWRRTLFLLSQGLIDLSVDSGSKGGYVLDPGSTNATVAYKPIFSKDRGDQPPHTYEDTFVDGDEPGLEGEATRSRLSQPSIFLPSSTPPVPYNQVVPLSGLEYLRQYHTSNVPVGTSAASVSVGPALSSASASSTIKKWNRAAGDEASQQNYDPSQQLEIDELEWNENLKDLRQQEVEDHDLNLQTENLSQQQIQVEDVRKTHELDPNNSRNKIEVKATAQPSFWEKLKGKLG